MDAPPGLSYSVFKYVKSCTKFLSRNMPPHMKVRVPIIPDDIPQLFERVAVDVHGRFRSSNKETHIPYYYVY